MLDEATIAALDAYSDYIREMAVERYPRGLFLIYQADQRCRQEFFERMRRSLSLNNAEAPLPDFNAAKP